MAFPKLGKAFSFIPYFGTIIAFLPDFLKLAKYIKEELKDYKHDQISKELEKAKKSMGSPDLQDRIESNYDFDDIVNRNFYD